MTVITLVEVKEIKVRFYYIIVSIVTSYTRVCIVYVLHKPRYYLCDVNLTS